MDFEVLDRYLLEGQPAKGKVIAQLLERRSDLPRAAAFYRGMEMLKDRTPDLTLVAFRLTLAGKPADDASVVRLRDAAARARAGEDGAAAAYWKELHA